MRRILAVVRILEKRKGKSNKVKENISFKEARRRLSYLLKNSFADVLNAHAHAAEAHNLGGFSNLPRYFAPIFAFHTAILEQWSAMFVHMLNNFPGQKKITTCNVHLLSFFEAVYDRITIRYHRYSVLSARAALFFARW